MERPGVETESDALKSRSVDRMTLMMKENMFSFAVLLPSVAEKGNGESESSEIHDHVIGFIGITKPPGIFYIFDQQHWGKGYATETLRNFLRTYWDAYPDGLIGAAEDVQDCLEADVAHGNIASENVLKKHGFVYVRDDIMKRPDREVPTRVFRLTRPKP